MAIIKVAIPASVPAAVADYQAQNAHLSAFINQVNSQAFVLTEVATTTVPALKQGCYINNGGTLYVVDSGDEAISGSPSDGNTYIKISVSGDNLVAAFVNDISGYTWNQAYGYLASGTDLILPYLLVKATASYTKYRWDALNNSVGGNFHAIGTIRGIGAVTLDSTLGVGGNATFGGTLGVTGAFSSATVNTGGGAYEVYKNTSAIYNNAIGADTVYTIGAMDVGEIRFLSFIIINVTAAHDFTINTPDTGSGYYVVMSGTGNISEYGGIFAAGNPVYTTEMGIDAEVRYGIIIRRES